MIQKKFAMMFFAALIVSAAAPISALACACCAEPGTYYLSTFKPRTFELDLLKEVRFATDAKLYTTEAGFDTMKGLDEVAKDSELEAHMTTYDEFDLASGFTGTQWRFEMRSTAGRKGVLTLPMPLRLTSFKVDIHDVEDRPNGPLLYKEYRFKGGVTAATGIFRPALAKGTSYTLVLQGRGVGCDEVQDYTHWRLDIDGPRASYAFYGKLSSGEKATAAK